MRAFLFLTLLALCGVLSFASCKSNDIAANNTTTTIGQQCNAAPAGGDSGSSNTCAGGVCTVNYCRMACTTDSQCPTGSICLSGQGGNGCRLDSDSEAKCMASMPCTTPGLVCGADMTCRNFCNANTPCTVPGDLCQADGACHGAGAPGDGGGQQDGTIAQDAGGSGSSSGSSGSSGSSSGASDAAGSPDTSFATCTGPALTQFGHVAAGDSNPNYISGLGVRTPTEMLIFSGYTGPDRASDAGTPPKVNQIDVQHFDLVTAKKTGPPTPLRTADVDGSLVPFEIGDGTGIGIYSAAVGLTPAGDIVIAIAYAGNTGSQSGYYVTFLDSTLTVQQTTQVAAISAATSYPNVAWEHGEFVVSWTYLMPNNQGVGLKLAQFHSDGTNAGSTSTVPTDDPNGKIYAFAGAEGEQGTVALAGGVFAVGYANVSAAPMLTLLDPATNSEIGSPIPLPLYDGLYGNQFLTVGATPQGFIAVRDGIVPNDAGSMTKSVLATFVATDGGVGQTYPFPDPPDFVGFSNFGAARVASDGTGAGFVLLDPSGAANFLYITGDGSTHLGPQTVLQQVNATVVNDLVSIMNLPGTAGASGSFAIGLWSSAEHLTRMAISGCPTSAGDAGH